MGAQPVWALQPKGIKLPSGAATAVHSQQQLVDYQHQLAPRSIENTRKGLEAAIKIVEGHTHPTEAEGSGRHNVSVRFYGTTPDGGRDARYYITLNYKDLPSQQKDTVADGFSQLLKSYGITTPCKRGEFFVECPVPAGMELPFHHIGASVLPLLAHQSIGITLKERNQLERFGDDHDRQMLARADTLQEEMRNFIISRGEGAHNYSQYAVKPQELDHNDHKVLREVKNKLQGLFIAARSHADISGDNLHELKKVYTTSILLKTWADGEQRSAITPVAAKESLFVLGRADAPLAKDFRALLTKIDINPHAADTPAINPVLIDVMNCLAERKPQTTHPRVNSADGQSVSRKG